MRAPTAISSAGSWTSAAHVEAGQLLAEIDTPELNQELERARAQLAQAEAALGLSKITAERWAGLLKTASVSEQENAEKQADFKLKTASAEFGPRRGAPAGEAPVVYPHDSAICRYHHGPQYRFGRSHRRRRRQGTLPPGADEEASGIRAGPPGDGPKHPHRPDRRDDPSGTSRPDVYSPR